VRRAINSLGPISFYRELSLPDSWVRYYGAHLHIQATEDPRPTAIAAPSQFFFPFSLLWGSPKDTP